MIALIQRVLQASVHVNEKVYSNITKGILVLLGIVQDDEEEDIFWLSNKIVHLRIFDDEKQKMNFSLKEIDRNILLVSQFTLCANTKKGNRPSYIKAAHPDRALAFYKQMIQTLSSQLGKVIQTGEFGTYMQIHLINDGPVTIYIDTKKK